MSKRAVLVVGERANSEARAVPGWPDVESAAYWRSMLAAGAFADRRSRDKLRSAGLDLDSGLSDSINLLPPGRGWDAVAAAAVAAAWSRRCVGRYRLVVTCGVRVAGAFGLSGGLAASAGRESTSPHGLRVLVVPHPSGLCRYWNDAGRVASLRRRVRRCLHRQTT